MSNGTHPAMNAAQGMIGSSMGSGLLVQGTLATGYRDDWMAPRVRIEVDKVSNGYVIAVGSERLIAKDLEELQQHFVAQIVSKLVLDKDK